MAIIIKKGAGIGRRQAAPLVDDVQRTAIKPPPPEPAPWTPKESLDWWTEHGLDPKAKPVACDFCGKHYYKPCSEAQHAGCQNFHFAEKRKQAVG